MVCGSKNPGHQAGGSLASPIQRRFHLGHANPSVRTGRSRTGQRNNALPRSLPIVGAGAGLVDEDQAASACSANILIEAKSVAHVPTAAAATAILGRMIESRD